jgi:hypothetical protein
MSLAMRRGRHSSTKSYRLRKGMRLTRNTTTNIKEILGVNAGQVINKNDEAWDAFFELLDLKNREGYHHSLGSYLYQAIGRIEIQGRREYFYT